MTTCSSTRPPLLAALLLRLIRWADRRGATQEPIAIYMPRMSPAERALFNEKPSPAVARRRRQLRAGGR